MPRKAFPPIAKSHARPQVRIKQSHIITPIGEALHNHQVGVATLDKDVLVAPLPTVECPYCDRALNPTGNVRTHVLLYKGAHYVFYRSHISCAQEALPHEDELLAMRALDLFEAFIESFVKPVIH